MDTHHTANCPISGPVNSSNEVHSDLGGFGWNAFEGIFLPAYDDILPFTPPELRVGGEYE